jgi:hypothetical protein
MVMDAVVERCVEQSPVYHPADLLKLYIYGYLNRIQSSRRLEREAQHNIELMWLTVRLARSVASGAGSTKPSLTPCRNGSARRLSKCACDGKQWSIHSAPSNHGWVPRIS